MDKIMGIGLIFACIAYSIFAISTIWMFPVYVIILFFAWILLNFGLIYFKKSGNLSEYIIPIIIMDIIFTCIFTSNASDVDFWKDNIAGAVFTPTFCLPAIIYIGLKLQKSHIKQIQIKINTLCSVIKAKLENELNNIIKLKNTIKKNNMSDKVLQNLITLISICGNDSVLKNTYEHSADKLFKSNISKFKGIIADSDMPQNKEQFDLYINKQLENEKEYKKILYELNTYDYKTLKTIYNQYKDLGVEK